MRTVIVTAFLCLIAAPSFAVVVRCPDGALWAGGDIKDCRCCPTCADGSKVMPGEECVRSAPPPAPAAPSVERLCGVKVTSAAMDLVSKMDRAARRVYVDPVAWAMLKYDARVGFGRWAYDCALAGHPVSIRHGNSGKELATYSKAWGYKSKE